MVLDLDGGSDTYFLISCVAQSEISQLKEDSEQMKKAKGEICSKILEKQKMTASLESDISTLSQVS